MSKSENNEKVSLWKLFSITAKIGGVTIGGGYAMVPIIREEFVVKHKFLQPEEFDSLLVIAQSMPGPIAVNTSTLVGYKLRKIPGVIAAVAGAIFFPTIIILSIAIVIGKFYNFLRPFLNGMKIPLLAIIVAGVLKLWKSSVRNLEDFVIFIVAFSSVTLLKLNPVYVILLGILYGIIRFFVNQPKGE
ncbi:chromate transporter [Fervidobacterium pennivorans subsp. shakshaketiis]|uniref:chromate transporter n=1 Tax=Fervidobacterium pennivorans TaxID=93466 RepID=UPI001436AB90|nr:chromate transporter [Fervidobacterium pennivorans]QIV77898.1 chromate transporter [Fervidobacterium pennivorans subsp. keratinolyticus]